jgi:hypothetical protein
MKKKMGIKILNFFLTLVILLALVNVASVSFWNFSILSWMSFGVKWIEYILAGFVGVVGLIGLISLFVQTLFKQILIIFIMKNKKLVRLCLLFLFMVNIYIMRYNLEGIVNEVQGFSYRFSF